MTGVHFALLPLVAEEAHKHLQRYVEQGSGGPPDADNGGGLSPTTEAALHEARSPRDPVQIRNQPLNDWDRNVMHSVTKDGGFSFHDHIGDGPSNGYMVSIDKQAEQAMPVQDVTPKSIQDYMSVHQQDLKDPNNYLGGWVHRGKVYLDVSRHVDDQQHALTLAKANHQIGIYDIGNGSTILTDQPKAAHFDGVVQTAGSWLGGNDHLATYKGAERLRRTTKGGYPSSSRLVSDLTPPRTADYQEPAPANGFVPDELVNTEWGAGMVIESTGRSVTIALEEGGQINLVNGTPGMDRLRAMNPRTASSRRCETCGGHMPNRTHRQRNDKGQLVCDSCKQLGGWSTSHAALDVVAQTEIRRREVEAIRSVTRTLRLQRQGAEDSIADTIAWARRCAEQAGDASVSRLSGTDVIRLCDYINDDALETVKWCRSNAERAGSASVSRISGRDVMYLCNLAENKMRHTSKVAHDSGDNATLNHCPFCGSGAIVRNSDDSTSCDFCHNTFTVQVQPAHPFMPQTIDGQPNPMPGMPAGQPTEVSGTDDPTVEESSDDVAEDPLGDADPASNGPVAPGQPPGKQPPPFTKADPSTNPGKGNDQPGDKKKSLPPWMKGKGDDKSAPSKGDDSKKADDKDDGKKKKSLPPWLKKKTNFRTASGATLDPDEYLAHLALEHADDRSVVLDAVRLSHMRTEIGTVLASDPDDARKGTCPACEGSGTQARTAPGYAPNDPQGNDDTECPVCDGRGWVTDEEARDYYDFMSRNGSVTAAGKYGGDEVPEDLVQAALKYWYGDKGHAEPNYTYHSRVAPDGGSYSIQGVRISAPGEGSGILYARDLSKREPWDRDPSPYAVEFYDGSGGHIAPDPAGGWVFDNFYEKRHLGAVMAAPLA